MPVFPCRDAIAVTACSLFSLVAFSSASTVGGAESAASQPLAGMGIMVGEVTATNVLVQVRLTQGDKVVDGDVPGAAGIVQFRLVPSGTRPSSSTDPKESQTTTVEAHAEQDFIARARFTGLKPGTKYICTTRIGATKESLHAGPEARFKTHPGPEATQPVRFVVVTGMNYAKFHGDDRIDREQHKVENNRELPSAYAGPDKHLGYPALAAILSKRPDFFVGTGDNVYYDTPHNTRAKTIAEMRQKWHEQFVQPRYLDLFAEVPTYWEIDDHDYRVDDCDNTGDYAPSPEEGRRVMLEQLPIADAGDNDAKTYRTHRVSRDLQIWLPENRMHRSPNAMPDGPGKSIWGAEQKAWLKRTLAESDATFKLLISPTPMIGPDDLRKTDNHTNSGGFQHERDEFFQWWKENELDKQNLYIVCGDRHWQYHSIHPLGMEEFSTGALVDANSRLGRKPGDPASTDPEGHIEQPYYQDPASGGFLLIDVTPGGDDSPAELSFQFYDENGELLHKHVKTPSM